MVLKFKKLSKEAIIPQRQTEWSAGLDLCAIGGHIIKAGERKLISTGLAVEIPEGFEGQIRGRSGNALKHGVISHIGTIDADYRGEVGVLLFNLGDRNFIIGHGDRIAQLIISQVYNFPIVEVSELVDTKRGSGGFGHTGK